MTTPATSYCNCMEDVKQRLKLIKSITQGYSPLGDEGFDAEVVCLLLRKILEQIAFSSLVVHQEIYRKFHDDEVKVWRAKSLLDRLGKAHPDFFPNPVKRGISTEPGVQHHFEPLTEGFLTKDDFVFLYDLSSEGIHAWNPLRDGTPILRFERSIAEWIARIELLLETHFVRLAGTIDVWLIQMNHPDDGLVHAFNAPVVAAVAPAPRVSVSYDFEI